MTESVKIQLSWGLLALAAIHAVILGFVMFAAHPPSHEPLREQWMPPQSLNYGTSVQSRVDRLETPASVNLNAQHEIKRAGGCPTCPQARYPSIPQSNQPLYINGERVVHIGPTVPIRPVAPAPPVNDVIPAAGSMTMPAVTSVADQPTKKKYQVLLFLDRSEKSIQMAQWFTDDAQLLQLRAASDFQVYSADNALYRARFAAIVPANQFPVILFQDATGGHIHAAGRNMIPDTAAELWADIAAGELLYRQAKSGDVQMSGAIKSKGYSWDDQISPTMSLSSADCPDGQCPSADTSWRPLDRLRPNRDGGLFDNLPAKAFVWANGSELATVGLMALAACLLFYILMKRGQ